MPRPHFPAPPQKRGRRHQRQTNPSLIRSENATADGVSITMKDEERREVYQSGHIITETIPKAVKNNHVCLMIAESLQGGGLALGPLRHPKPRNGLPFWASFLVGLGLFGRSGGSKIRRGTDTQPQFRAPFLALGPFFRGQKA